MIIDKLTIGRVEWGQRHLYVSNSRSYYDILYLLVDYDSVTFYYNNSLYEFETTNAL